jgi:hypothetical protein
LSTKVIVGPSAEDYTSACDPSRAKTLELWGSIITFVGGAILAYDAFFATQKQDEARGTQTLRSLPVPVGDQAGKELPSPQQLDCRETRHIQLRGRLGFGVMAIGFLLDLLAKLGT